MINFKNASFTFTCECEVNVLWLTSVVFEPFSNVSVSFSETKTGRQVNKIKITADKHTRSLNQVVYKLVKIKDYITETVKTADDFEISINRF